ncbi:Sterile alpha motif domain-containing protein [Quillaja saponaria]|uniref:Sterile alpha motif domain-containing protein n=1 Tax=Quillaja saponaria TaxID=32244 RepID=A0AAD7VKE6_QUISA|nr:Sterile alpha motif domain-containing protein [Quillaja saponaria]
MDWFSWLSKTSLEPSLIYEYGLSFARNELGLEDVSFFNHEILQSMGITIAKHRLEILKLAKRKENVEGTKGLFRFILAITKTKKCLRKCVSKLVFREEAANAVPETKIYYEQWKDALTRGYKSEDVKEVQKPVHRTRRIALSGPLDGKVNEQLAANRVLKLSGPLDGRFNEKTMMYPNRTPIVAYKPFDGKLPAERLMATNKSPGPFEGRLMYTNRSPRPYWPLDGRAESPMVCSHYNKTKVDLDLDDDDDHALWATLFQDLKPN